MVAGADTHLAELALEAVLSATVGDGDRSDSVTVLRGDETGWGRVLEAARTGSLFAPRRAVVVRGADAMKGDGDELLAYLDDPSPGTALVLLAAKPDKRKVLWKRLMERATVHGADPLKGRALRGYIVEQVRRRKLGLGDAALEELIERVGQDLRRAMGEMDKLEAFAVGRKGALSAEDVAAVLGRGMGQPLYRISDALCARRPEKVLSLMEAVLEDGEPPLKILGTLHRALRQVRGAIALRESRAPRDTVAARLGIMPFKVGDILDASRSWSDAELKAAFAALDRADRRVKSGGDPRSALTSAVVEACARPPGVRPGGSAR